VCYNDSTQLHKGGWASPPMKGGMSMSVYESLTLMIAFATLIYLITRDKNKK